MDLRTKLKLQREASAIKKEIAETTAISDKLKLQRKWSDIIKQLKGNVPAKSNAEDDKGQNIDDAANEAATSTTNEREEPTQAQKEAGNYKKGNVTIAGMAISIENPKGSTRTGIGADGETWTSTMYHHYGDIKRTIGADSDSIDVFIGEAVEFDTVFVVDQINPDTRQFDEHKVMLGFTSITEAKKAYLKNYDSNWQGLGATKPMELEAFKTWVYAGKKDKPVKYVEGQLQADTQEPSASKDTINFSQYMEHSQIEIKQAVRKLSDDGYQLPVLTELLTKWLDKNESVLIDQVEQAA